MDTNDHSAKVFTKRLENLEEKLLEMGYEIVKLEDTPYYDGMTVKATFVCDENLKSDERIITRVIKPQINFNNVLIRAAEIEVKQGI
jgi:hypothetical protein